MRANNMSVMRMAVKWLGRGLVIGATALSPLAAQTQRPDSAADCAPRERPLACTALVAVPTLPSVRGALRLAPVPVPFGIAVTRDGRLRTHLSADLHGL